jgi:hypothetical protein
VFAGGCSLDDVGGQRRTNQRGHDIGVLDDSLGQALRRDRCVEAGAVGEVDNLKYAVDGSADGGSVAALRPWW